MASLMDNLADVLTEECTQYQKLVALGQEKKQAIILANIPQLEEITGMEQDVASVLRNLDNRRADVMKDIATVLGKDTADITVTRLIQFMEKQPAEQERLQKIRTSLLAIGEQMRDINEQNATLLNQAMEMVEFDLTLFKSMRQAPETANYNKNAYSTGDLLGGGGFDTRQ